MWAAGDAHLHAYMYVCVWWVCDGCVCVCVWRVWWAWVCVCCIDGQQPTKIEQRRLLPLLTARDCQAPAQGARSWAGRGACLGRWASTRWGRDLCHSAVHRNKQKRAHKLEATPASAAAVEAPAAEGGGNCLLWNTKGEKKKLKNLSHFELLINAEEAAALTATAACCMLPRPRPRFYLLAKTSQIISGFNPNSFS